MSELIITEKPSSAKKVAEALADRKPILKKQGKSSYFELSHNQKQIVVTSAVGHLYGLAEKKKNGWTYPVFDVEWKETHEGKKGLGYVKEYINLISALAKQADEFTIACDYDIEGEVIGLNVVRFACKQKDANRMKFSTLTREDLVDAYEHKMHHLDWGQAHAGETRHILDWYYGINLSRALTASVKAAGSFKLLSIGRVQGPSLKLLADREREIQSFVSEPYWEIGLWGTFRNTPVEAWHEKEKIVEKKEVERILAAVRNAKEAKVQEVKRTQREQNAPFPFDLTTLQTEAYNVFKISPKETLSIAQSLYLAGLTSYPRTSSQQLDPKLGFAKILSSLGKQAEYGSLCNELLKLPALRPNNGKKTDPAHPAIFPTGLAPKALHERQRKVYDLIVRRFMATFAPSALRETMEVWLDVNKELFVASGSRTVQENWHKFYKPYLRLEEVTLPPMKEGDIVQVKKIDKVDKETQPPKRYNQSSLIRELEKRHLGTKATRADIVDRLFQRGYIEGAQIAVTQLGMETVLLLEKHAPTILDEQLTAHFEEDMEQIREGKEKPEKVLREAKEFLTVLLEAFKKKERSIGEDILKSLRATQEEQNYIGVCPVCTQGKLVMKRGKFGRFVACEKYPECTATFKVPAVGTIRSTDKTCELCQHPIIKIVQRRGSRETCLNPDCQSKTTVEERKEIKNIESGNIERKCPKCGNDMVLRRSVYGSFLGCSGYPKCRTTEKLDKNGVNNKQMGKNEEKK